MAVRLNFIVEGQTEEAFVNTVLRPHLEAFSVWANARCVETSRKGNIKHRGGIMRYPQAKRDIGRWLREDRNLDACFTTMFDLYSLPEDFPGYSHTIPALNPYIRVKDLESVFPQYQGRKSSAGPIIAGRIGLPILRSQCEHSAEWLGQLEALDQG